ncbi:hypothetical protein COV19_03665 [Candidatus Woesearchaeota archaeon CG10_big_fil_rev_8_21_14_0_10_44_13]|nr:MAG: hypothetical protein COV19_03665 [Candidatus Woesearchaeota archaeon CG10_big_fil_rev_8_21_14_0_10_44_13]
MATFDDAIRQLEDLGLTDVLMPFLLVFTVVYAILHKTKILGDEKKNFNVMISLIMALAVIIPHVTNPGSKYDVVDIINQSLPHVSLLIILVLMVLLLVGIFGVGPMWEGSSISGGIALIAFIAVVYIFGAAANFWPTVTWLNWLDDPETQSLIIVLLVFALIVWFITKEEPKPRREKFFDNVGKFFRKQ